MGFISVNDQLPDEGKPLIVVQGKRIYQKTYDNGIFYEGSHGVAGPRGVVDPTHWMYISDLLGEIDAGSDEGVCAV